MAGIAAALARAYACLGDGSCAESARKALEAVKQAYRQDIRGWASPEEKVLWLAGRAPWEPDIAWQAMTALELLPGGQGQEEAREVAELALKGLMEEKELLHRDTLCEGNALWAMSLTRAAELFGRAEYLDRGAQVWEAMVRRADSKGTFNVNAPKVKSFFDVSFYYGTLGIGYGALYCRNVMERW